MSEPPKRNDYKYEDEQRHDAYVANELQRQRTSIYVLGMVLVGLVVLAIGGFNVDLSNLFKTPEANQNEPENDNENPKGSNSSSTSKALPKDGTYLHDGEYHPIYDPPLSLPTFTPPTTLLDQRQADVVQGLCIAAATPDMIYNGEPLPDDKQWLAAILSDVGVNFCDNNRVLDAALPRDAEQMIARCSLPLDEYEMMVIHRGTNTRHVIVVEFETKGRSWTVHGRSHHSGSEGVPPSKTSEWPESGALELMLGDLTSMAEQLTGFDLRSDGIGFDLSDNLGRKYAEFLDAISRGSIGDADQILAELRSQAPGFDFPIYRRIASMISPSDPEGAMGGMATLRAYVDKGGDNPRLLSLYASTATMVKQDTERARDIAHELVAEDRLNMSAYSALRSLEDDLRSIRNQRAIPPEERDRTSIDLYPLDGRYHLSLAKTLYIDPATADEAVDVAQQAFELRPWSNDALYHIGFAMINSASFHENKADWSRSQIDRTYEIAASLFERMWLSNPNRAQFVFELWLKALTHEHRWLPKDRQRRFITWLVAKVAVHIANARGAEQALYLFAPEEHFRMQAELMEMLDAPDENDLRADLLLMVGASVLYQELPSASSQDEQKAISAKLGRTMRLYRKRGGRTSELDHLWTLFKDAGTDG